MGQFWDFLRSVSIHFVKSQICPILGPILVNLDVKFDMPVLKPWPRSFPWTKQGNQFLISEPNDAKYVYNLSIFMLIWSKCTLSADILRFMRDLDKFNQHFHVTMIHGSYKRTWDAKFIVTFDANSNQIMTDSWAQNLSAFHNNNLNFLLVY